MGDPSADEVGVVGGDVLGDGEDPQLYNWRRAYGGMDTDAGKELKELREQNARLKRLLAEFGPMRSRSR